MKKQKLDRKNYMFDSRKGEVLIKTPGQIDGKDFVVMGCVDCEIYVCDYTSQVFVDDSVNCKIYFGPVEGSLFVRDCKGIEISCAASQFRVSDSSDIKCFVYAASDPALEKVTNIQFAPYNFTYPHIDEHFTKAKLNVNEDKWSEVFDFTPNATQKNWSIMSPTDFPGIVVKQIDEFPEPPSNPVPIPKAYGGTSTKSLRVGSVDAREAEKGGNPLDFAKLMGKDNVTQIMEQQITTEISHSQPVVTNQSNQEDWFNELETPQPQQTANTNGSQINQLSTSQLQSTADIQYTQPYSILNGSITQASEIQSNPTTIQNNYGALDEKQNVANNQIRQKDENERIEKQQKQQSAKQWLLQWKKTRDDQIIQNKAENKRNHQIYLENKSSKTIESSWQLVASNIAIKDGEQKGDKNISQMRQAILKKKQDLHR